ncbi:MAG: hypothetical protein M1510_10435 [Nitrospirae bacterium]|nr:hypothetical protein [Nitrospirota bacterium]MCL5236552.1 hypothetical protein [Nitrospirota bacterium]
MFEHHRKPLLSRRAFLRRQVRHTAFSLIILGFSIGIGMIGYHYFGRLCWVDAFLNASMILTGMGPVDHMDSSRGKIFAALYALFSGIAFLTFAAVLFSPIYHRFLHKFHLAFEEDENKTG